jgi:hypothetical protein
MPLLLNKPETKVIYFKSFVIELKALKADFTVVHSNSLFDCSAVFAEVPKLVHFVLILLIEFGFGYMVLI